MRKTLFCIALALTCGISSPAFASKGTVSYICGDYLLVSTPRGYAILEVYGYGPDKGSTIVGEFETYGMKDVFDISGDRDFRVYVDDYWLSRDSAVERFFKKRCR